MPSAKAAGSLREGKARLHERARQGGRAQSRFETHD
jgi:hypothetical protein